MSIGYLFYLCVKVYKIKVRSQKGAIVVDALAMPSVQACES